LVRRNDGAEVTLEDLEAYLKEASAYDNAHFVLMMAADLGEALVEKNCPSKDKPVGFKWHAP